MNRNANRRTAAITLTLLAVGLTALGLQWVRNKLGDESTFTGWVLLLATAGLYLLSARKKLIARKLGPVALWLQLHMYMGTFACTVFLMHIGWPVRGTFEIILASSFGFVSVTGIYLGYLSRVTPQRLAALPEDHHQDGIPALQAAVAAEAHMLALQSAAHGEGATLAEYYQRRLLGFFRTPRGMVYQMMPNGLQRRKLLRELQDLDRYLGESGTGDRVALTAMVKAKDDLDYQYALQYRLKLFYLFHVSLTWSLALMVAVHVVLVHRFQGAIY